MAACIILRTIDTHPGLIVTGFRKDTTNLQPADNQLCELILFAP